MSDNSTIEDTMKTIDENKGRFALVVKDKKLIGVLSDGDIRRLILSGLILKDRIQFDSSFVYIDIHNDFNKVCEIFREYNSDFLPILNKGELINLITKAQFHAILLEDIQYSSEFNFSQVETETLKHEIYNRPWGFYKSTWLSSHAQAKIITIFPNSEISLQKHCKREEHWVIVKGAGVAIIGNERVQVTSGDYIQVPIECKHSIINLSLSENLILSEVQLGSYFGEDDIVRYKDKYGRS